MTECERDVRRQRAVEGDDQHGGGGAIAWLIAVTLVLGVIAVLLLV